MTSFVDRLCDFTLSHWKLDPATREDALLAIEDTWAVILAGWHEPVSRNVRQALGASYRMGFGASRLSAEQEALLHGTAAHALDYDDVLLTSVTHPSAVCVPAILSLVARRPELRPRVLSALAVGVAVNATLGRIFGFGHYDRGWHATATIGPVAAAASLVHLLGLNERQARSALALAAAQAGGLQSNFGTMAKPVQAGFAAANAVRAVLFAECGVTGSTDPFGSRGYFDLYGDAGVVDRAATADFEISCNYLSRKIYPCCYASHRMIDAAVAARAEVARWQNRDRVRIAVAVPYGTMRPLRVEDPQDGAEAKFCAAYITATALLKGGVVFSDFTDQAVRRPEIRALMEKIFIAEAPLDEAEPHGLDQGSVTLTVSAEDRLIVRTTSEAYPGSPAAPVTREQMDAKIADCLGRFAAARGRGWSIRDFQTAVAAYAV